MKIIKFGEKTNIFNKYTMENIKDQKVYNTPQITIIQLDNEISLQLESSPPEGPGEPTGFSTEYITNDPFKTGLV